AAALGREAVPRLQQRPLRGPHPLLVRALRAGAAQDDRDAERERGVRAPHRRRSFLGDAEVEELLRELVEHRSPPRMDDSRRTVPLPRLTIKMALSGMRVWPSYIDCLLV